VRAGLVISGSAGRKGRGPLSRKQIRLVPWPAEPPCLVKRFFFRRVGVERRTSPSSAGRVIPRANRQMEEDLSDFHSACREFLAANTALAVSRCKKEMPPSTQYSEGGTPFDQPDSSIDRPAFELTTTSRTRAIILKTIKGLLPIRLRRLLFRKELRERGMAINDADLLWKSSRWADLETALSKLGPDRKTEKGEGL
jgi:hypothetical protein